MPEDGGLCCHVGGQIEFDYAGNLYLSTGDDTNPFQSAGDTPIDDRANRNRRRRGRRPLNYSIASGSDRMAFGGAARGPADGLYQSSGP